MADIGDVRSSIQRLLSSRRAPEPASGLMKEWDVTV